MILIGILDCLYGYFGDLTNDYLKNKRILYVFLLGSLVVLLLRYAYMKKILIFAFVLALVSSEAAHFDRVLLTNHPDSKCLDGTPGAYFISRGTDPKRFVIYF